MASTLKLSMNPSLTSTSAGTSSFLTTTKLAVASYAPSVLPYDLPSQLRILLILELTCSKVHPDYQSLGHGGESVIIE